VYETQYYSSTNCTRNGSPYGQSDYVINVDDACNAVKSPNSPHTNTTVAYTEYVGLSFVGAGEFSPSQEPTAAPSFRPTRTPTAKPSPNNLVIFGATQVKIRKLITAYM
jgi:hypothetical protein